MGVIVNLVEEIRNRLSTATGAGKALVGVKKVQVGNVEGLRKPENCPYIVISLDGSGYEAVFKPHGNVDVLDISIHIVINKMAAELNKLYNTTSGTGPIYLFETVMNTIEKNTSDEIDVSFGGKANNLRDYTYSTKEDAFLFEYIISFQVQTVQYITGGR